MSFRAKCYTRQLWNNCNCKALQRKICSTSRQWFFALITMSIMHQKERIKLLHYFTGVVKGPKFFTAAIFVIICLLALKRSNIFLYLHELRECRIGPYPEQVDRVRSTHLSEPLLHWRLRDKRSKLNDTFIQTHWISSTVGYCSGVLTSQRCRHYTFN